MDKFYNVYCLPRFERDQYPTFHATELYPLELQCTCVTVYNSNFILQLPRNVLPVALLKKMSVSFVGLRHAGIIEFICCTMSGKLNDICITYLGT